MLPGRQVRRSPRGLRGSVCEDGHSVGGAQRGLQIRVLQVPVDEMQFHGESHVVDGVFGAHAALRAPMKVELLHDITIALERTSADGQMGLGLGTGRELDAVTVVHHFSVDAGLSGVGGSELNGGHAAFDDQRSVDVDGALIAAGGTRLREATPKFNA